MPLRLFALFFAFVFTAASGHAGDTGSTPAAATASASASSVTAPANAAAAVTATTAADAGTTVTAPSATVDAGVLTIVATPEPASAATGSAAAQQGGLSPVDAAVEEGTSAQNDPTMILITAAIAAYLFYMWLQDYRSNRAGQPSTNAFPGATPASTKAVLVAIVGALVILAAETGGEIALGISGEQSTMTVLALLAITAAAFFEELIFRGYLVVSNRGRALLIGSIVGFSVIFALFHPFLWEMTTPEGVPGWQVWNADWTFNFTLKGWFSTGIVLVNSLWFYAMRFNPLNPSRSLVPCMAAHLATNWGVFAVKLAQGHVSGLW